MIIRPRTLLRWNRAFTRAVDGARSTALQLVGRAFLGALFVTSEVLIQLEHAARVALPAPPLADGARADGASATRTLVADGRVATCR